MSTQSIKGQSPLESIESLSNVTAQRFSEIAQCLVKDIIHVPAVANENIRVQMSRDVRKPDFCICENKDADQLRGNREADQRLCFRYTDSTIPLLSESEISSL